MLLASTCTRTSYRLGARIQTVHRIQTLTSSSAETEDERNRRLFLWGPRERQEQYVGKGRKKQRVVSAALTRTALDRTTNVVMLRDAGEDDPPSPLDMYPMASPDGFNANDFRLAAHGGDGQSADEAEVNASIEALRPKAKSMDERDVDKLCQRLARRYTQRQLSRYLIQGTQAEAGLRSIWWRPGRTPLSQRHGTTRAVGKQQAARQILRVVWGIEARTEEEVVGEVELGMTPWQMSMLFDLVHQGGPYYEALISAPLTGATQVQEYRQDGVVRVVGRRHDSEEVAIQLTRAMHRVQRLELNGTNLLQLDDELTRKAIAFISNLTKSVMTCERAGVLTIFNTSMTGAAHAQRLLLSAVDSCSKPITSSPASNDDMRPLSMIPCGTTCSSLHWRWRNTRLARQVEPLVNGGHAHKIRDVGWNWGENLRRTEPQRVDSDSYWNESVLTFGNWNVHFGQLLHSGEENQSTARHLIPGMETVLSFFEDIRWKAANPRRTAQSSIDWMRPSLMVHLIPSLPLLKAPKIEMRFNFTTSAISTDQQNVILTGMRAVFDDEVWGIPLPGHVVDLTVSRRLSMVADLRKAVGDARIQDFAEVLQQSVAEGKGVLHVAPRLVLKMPGKLLGLGKHDVPVEYLCEHLEQAQHMDLAPRRSATDTEMHAMLKSLADGNLRLEVKDVEGGAIYGNRTELTLRAQRPWQSGLKSNDNVQDVKQMGDEQAIPMIHAAVQLAGLLSRSAAGTLQPFRKVQK